MANCSEDGMVDQSNDIDATNSEVYKNIIKELLIKTDEEFTILLHGTQFTTILLISWGILGYYRPIFRIRDPCNYIVSEHILTGYFYIFYIFLYNALDNEDVQNILFMIFGSSDIFLTVLTLIFSVVTFLKLCLEDVLITKKRVMIALGAIIALFEILEEFGSDYFSELGFDIHVAFVSFCVIFALFVFIIDSCIIFKNVTLSRYYALCFFTMILSDICFLVYNIFTVTEYGNILAVIFIVSVCIQILSYMMSQIIFLNCLTDLH